MQDINGHISRQCGDLNLVAAMMACGIMLDPHTPCRVVEAEDGRNYSTYSYLAYSADGTTTADALMMHWLGKLTLPDDDGFPWICQFIKSRPRGVQRSSELLDFALVWLAERDNPVIGLANFEAIPDYLRKSNPKAMPSFILAYLWNREICYKLHKSAGRAIFLGNYTHNGGRFAQIGNKLPSWQRKELLSRYLG